MTPFRFGPLQRQMYATYHPAAHRRQPSVGVLLCNPYGQEAVRIHRLYRLLAERLAADGQHVMRFDYYATGESDGDDEEGEPAGWCDDIRIAHAELQRRARCSRSIWFGARLGAALVSLASVRAGVAPDLLLLWEPLFDGPAYMAELGRSHARATYNPLTQGQQRPDETLGAEAIGFAVGPALREQLGALKLDALLAARACEIVVLAPPGDADAARLQQGLRARGTAAEVRPLRHDLVWAAEEAMGSALVPAEVLQALQSHIA